MIVASSAARCDDAASRCASRRSAARPNGEPNVGAPSSRAEDYRLWYTLERSFAWLGAYRRLLIRWEHLFGVYRSFFTVAAMIICVKRLAQAVG